MLETEPAGSTQFRAAPLESETVKEISRFPQGRGKLFFSLKYTPQEEKRGQGRLPATPLEVAQVVQLREFGAPHTLHPGVPTSFCSRDESIPLHLLRAVFQTASVLCRNLRDLYISSVRSFNIASARHPSAAHRPHPF